MKTGEFITNWLDNFESRRIEDDELEIYEIESDFKIEFPNSQFQINLCGSYDSCGYDAWYYGIAWIDEDGKLQMDSYTRESY